jgi:hypothetical protein
LDDAIEVDGDMTHLRPVEAAEALYNNCSPEVVKWAVDQLSTQTLASFRGQRTSAKARAETIYIRCTNDHAIDSQIQQLMSEECDFALDLDSDHSPFLSQPLQLCDVILG